MVNLTSLINSTITTTVNPITEDSGNNNNVGSASDYILIAMIVAMMLCMAVCCLCLFCRSTSSFTVCGYNCDVNDRNNSVGNDDISELHEVVPLTPAMVDTYNMSDIENKLKSDPPPPQYSEITGSSVLDRFKWRSKKKTNTGDNGKDDVESSKGNHIVRSKTKRSERRSRFSKPFQRSTSVQVHRDVSFPKSSTSLKAKGFKGTDKKSSLQHGASDCNAVIPKTVQEEVVSITAQKPIDIDNKSLKEITEISQECKDHAGDAEMVSVTVEKPDIDSKSLKQITESSQQCKEHEGDVYDDEVFM